MGVSTITMATRDTPPGASVTRGPNSATRGGLDYNNLEHLTELDLYVPLYHFNFYVFV